MYCWNKDALQERTVQLLNHCHGDLHISDVLISCVHGKSNSQWTISHVLLAYT